MPTDDELNVLKKLLEVLKNVYYLTNTLAGEKEKTGSNIKVNDVSGDSGPL
uniref:Uncharacterized protein n=1 Tax=Amphimedon queenslandica TaxID=400682 RepID=A0A1X7UWA5_AMPQE